MDIKQEKIIKPDLQALFQRGWNQCRAILFSAPCGFGKTTSAELLLEGRTVCSYTAAAQEPFAVPFAPDCEAVLIDDLQLLDRGSDQQLLCEWIRENPDKHFILLSRGAIPGWLMPFQITGLLFVIDHNALLFDRATTGRLLQQNHISVSGTELTDIQNESIGYPLALALLCDKMAGGVTYSKAVADAVRREMFRYYEETVYRLFELPLRRLMLNLAPFEQFDQELAKMVSGDSRAGELLGRLQRDTSMLIYDGLASYHFWPVFRAFLLWELMQEYTVPEQNAVYSRAALFYELHDDYAKALDCYARCGEHRKVSELLVKNAELHPGVGHYYEMERYYYAMPKEEVLRSPVLLCGMSMLTALNLEYEQSEQWYQLLKGYASHLKKTDAEYREVQGRLAYLDIALPQRGSKGLTEVIGSVFHILTNQEIKLPAFSVTSTLPSIMNGGKDFCEWSKKDDLLYATMRKAVETVLGRDGVGLADCSLCESKFEKGEDISAKLLALMSRIGEIQRKGTPDIEFATMGLLARVQVAEGKAQAALETLGNLRDTFAEAGETRFLPNLDAMRCRIWLRLGDTESALRWYREKAPKSGTRLWVLWRYQYLTKSMVQIMEGNCDEALVVLVQLIPYVEYCGRVMDGIHIRLLMAICYFRMGDATWQTTLSAVLSTAVEYRFIRPIAQYGGAVLPLLTACEWKKDPAYLERLIAATRMQAVNYPNFLKCEAELAEPLSAAELQVLKLVCHNLSNQEIGEILGIKLATVKTHVSRILQKLGVKRRSEAKEAAETLHLL